MNIPVEENKSYSFEELEEIFDFDYKKPSGIKLSQKYNCLCLFSSKNSPYEDKIDDSVIFYSGQNTGEGEQKLIFGNKILYDLYQSKNKEILFFKDYYFQGLVLPHLEPYQKEGRWIFPLRIKSQ